MTELHLLYAAFGVAATALALISRRIRELPLSEPLVALVLGVLLGPAVAGLLVLEAPTRDVVLLEGSRLLLAASVMAAALRFRARDLRILLPQLTLLVAVVMPVAALLVGAAGLLLGLPIALAAVLGACLCPTDPVLAASVVTGDPAERDIPGRLRKLLTGESGANDGLALPLVGLAVAVALPHEGPGGVVPRLLWEVLGGIGIGVVLGVLVGLGLRWATRDDDLEPGPELVLTLLLAVATLGVARLAGTGAVLAAFAAGIAYNATVGSHTRESQDDIDEAVNRYAVLPLFVVLGAVLPWSDWVALGPAALLFVAAVLLIRRPPVVIAAARALRVPQRDAAFMGWFGPIGVSAVFYLAHSRHEGVADPRLFAAGTLAVVASVVAFGLSSSPGRRLYAQNGHGAADDGAPGDGDPADGAGGRSEAGASR